MQAILRDLRYGARTLRQSPALAVVAVLALTLGIGLTTTMFSIVYGALMKGLPFEQGDRIVLLERANRATHDHGSGFPVHDYVDLAAQQRSFSGLAAYFTGTVNVSGTERAERFDGGFVTANLFRTLRVRPVLGRDFRDGEDRPGAEPVAIIGYRMWQERFGGAPDVLGRPIRANGVAYTVVGVMPDGFRFPSTEEIWLPMAVDPLGTERGQGQWVDVVGRLRDGVSPDRASTDLAGIAARLAAAYPKTNENVTAQARPFVEASLGDEPRTLLYTMLGAVFLVLLIACTNVANLLLARAAYRTREVGIRTALGASRWEVMRQFLLEAFVLAGLATLLGVGVAQTGIALFNRSIVDTQPPFFIDIALHPPVLLFSAGLALLTTLLAGALPAVQSSRPNLHDVLKEETRGGSSGLRIGRLSRGLVMFEIALSCGLLVAAGLMVKSIVKLRTVDYGFRTEGIFTARLGFPAAYTDTAAQVRFFEQLVERLNELPGAAGASLSSGLPGTGVGMGPLAVEGKTYTADTDYPRAANMVVTPGFFDVFGLPVTRGRALDVRDEPGTEPVAVVNARFARELLGGEPLGRRVRLGDAHSKAPWVTVVGVVPDVHSGLSQNPRPPMLYLPLAQHHQNFLSIAVHARGADPMTLTTPVRDAVAALDRDIPLYWVYSMREALARPTWFYRVFGTIFMIFGVVALFLAAVGLYAVMAFAVGRRTREFGIRMALGAQGRDVVRLILRQGAVQLGVGMVAGLALAAAVAQLLRIILFDVQPRDPGIFASVVAVLAVSGLLACLLPAWRATRVPPQTALRVE
ncbi:MAG TPA: ABC transporter permease [Gemmatimonadaceae bacterium]|nr:ABC transporter permease [Gemmatimonadaceae bacterium]